MNLPDIDIDVRSDTKPDVLGGVLAVTLEGDKFQKHPCGVYFQEIPTHSGMAAIPYEEAEELGYYKFDFLHNSVYSHFSSHEEIEQFLSIDPDWSLLTDTSVVPRLFQLAKHADVLQKIKPKSVMELADCLAIIRPGKREYISSYLMDREKVRPWLYKEENGYAFKKAHAVSYALVVVLQLHLIAGNCL